MSKLCNKNDCSVFDECTDVIKSMKIPETVMEEVMKVMHQTSNYLIVKNNVSYDFEMNGVNLRNYYNKLLEISDHCRI